LLFGRGNEMNAMKTLRLALLLSFSSAASLAGCSVESDGVTDPGSGSERGVGKADGVWGSCASEYGDACGGPAEEGNCWCDEQCADYGDCCADKVDVCGGDEPVDPEPKLCLGDAACGEGMHCDHSECLSGCSGAEICPAVCFGQCVPGEAECDVDPLTVLCAPGTLFDVDACACVPVEEPACELPGDEYVAVDGEELFADLGAFEGQSVLLSGTSVTGFPICTKAACSPENPCCNSCGAGIEMDLGAGRLDMSGIGCGGNECTVMDNCEYGMGEEFIAWGKVTQNFGFFRLEIDGHCAG
jgi:hypothetical protein